MTTMSQEYLAALLAKASYRTFSNWEAGIPFSRQALIDALTLPAGTQGAFTLAEAQFFADNFELVAFRSNGGALPLQGFQAAMFRQLGTPDPDSAMGESPDRLVLAIRGTTPGNPADLSADAQVALIGLAAGQYEALRNFMADLQRPVSQGGLGLIDTSTRIDLTGHSLGGHLVQAMQLGFGSMVHQAYTYNSAGIGGAVAGVRDAILRLTTGQSIYTGSAASQNTANIVATPGLEVVSSLFSGARLSPIEPTFTEDQLGSGTIGEGEGAIGNHSVERLVDALAVYRVFETLVGEQNFNRAAVTQILQASARLSLDSLENCLNALARIMGVPGTALYSDRNSFIALANSMYEELSGRSPSSQNTLLSLVGIGADRLVEQAMRSDAIGMGYRYALLNEIPFVVGGADYEELNAVVELDLASGSLDYWYDRARYLETVLAANVKDNGLGGPAHAVVTDLQTGAVFTSLPEPTPDSNRIVFGRTFANDTIAGGDGDDRLFGGLGTGSDQLEGGGGNDYLEGGAGDDILVSGSGQHDTLNGGAGDDTYEISADAHSITIRDSDETGHIIIERENSSAYTLGSSDITEIASSPGHYEDDEGNRYQLSGSNLIVSLEDGRTILIENFQGMTAGALGLTLQSGAVPTAPEVQPGTPTFSVAPSSPPDPPNEATYGRYADDPSLPYSNWLSPGVVLGGTGAEQVVAQSVAGNRYYVVAAGMGDSDITGDAGQNFLVDDALELPDDTLVNIGESVGNDVLRGGDGNDILLTHGGNDWAYGDDGNDIVIDQPEAAYGSTAWVSGAGHSNSDHLFGMAGIDILAANGGSAFMDGGTGNDELYGGANDDTLIGGEGDDILSGDTRLQSSPWTAGGGPSGPPVVIENLNGIWEGEQAEAGNDNLFGDAGADTLIGGLGNDFIDGGADNDLIQGDLLFIWSHLASRFSNHDLDPGNLHGADVLRGGAGADIVYGGGGADQLYGDGDGDVLYGDDNEVRSGALDSQYHGDDFVDGGAGDDWLYGNGGNDTLLGGDNDDHSFGGAGNDVIDGQAGNDILAGDDESGVQGSDTIHGGDGNDLVFGLGGNDSLYGDGGSDTISGGDGDDVLEGGDGDDYSASNSSIGLFGGDGNDTLRGGLGRDRLQGEGGNDVLEADSGSDLLFGGAGDDTFVLALGAGQVQITDSDGASTLRFGVGVSAAEIRVSMSNGLVYIDYGLSDYAFMDVATFNAISSVQFSEDVILDSATLSHLFQPGSIFFDQSIALGTGVDAGEIGFQRWNSDLLVTYSGSVSNWVDSASLSSRNVMFERRDGADFGMPAGTHVLALTNWYESNPASYINQIAESGGGTFDLAAVAAAAPIRIEGTADADVLSGTATADVIVAHEGADLLDGGAGDDDLSGNAGIDLLLGGAGNDTYRVGIGDGADIIIDEDGSADVLRLGAGVTLANLTVTETNLGLTLQVGAAESGDSVLLVDRSMVGGPTYPIEQVVLGDGTVLTTQQLLAHVTGNHRPVLTGQIPDQELTHGQALSYTVPAGLFVDPDAGDTLTYQATLVGGASLPSWLTFNPTTRTFSGTPVGDALEVFAVRVSATDDHGISAGADFQISYDGTLFVGTSANDAFVGTVHADRMYGSDGDDLLQGGRGDDLLDGGSGDDQLEGGAGVDVYLLNANSGHDVVVDTSERNRIQFAADSGVTISSLSVTRVGDDLRIGYGSNYVTMENWYGPDGRNADVVIVQGGLEYLYAPYQLEGLLSGTDTAPHAASAPAGFLVVNEGSSFTYQLPANLFTDPQSQASLTYSVDFLPAWLTFDPLTRTLSGTAPASSSGATFGMRVYASDGINNPSEPEFTDIQVYTRPSLTVVNGTAAADTLSGTFGHDHILGGAGDDIIDAVAGNDIVEAGEGNDEVTFNAGDIIDGGSGADFIHGSGSADISGGAGDDRLIMSGGLGAIAGGDGDDYVEGGQILSGGSGNDTLIGNSSANDMFAGEGDDVLDGKGGTDELWAGSGNDVLLGGGGNDELQGEAGNDRYDGGSGNDTLRDTGGGDDVYVGFSATSGSDTIVDGFGYDVIEFSSSIDLRLDQMTFTRPVSSDFVITVGAAAQLTLGFSSATSLPIDELVIYNGGIAFRYTAAQLIAHQAGTNLAPVRGDVAVGVQAAAIDQTFSFTVPLNFFIDVASQLDLAYSATRSDGGALPTWLSFDSVTRTLSGTPAAADSGVIAVAIRGLDEGGLTGSSAVWLNVGNSITSGSASSESLVGSALGEQMAGLAGDDTIAGLAGDDILDGGEGNDQLDGGTGADRLSGSSGNDIYIVDNALDAVFEAANEGIDEVRASITFVLGGQVENLLLTGASAIDGTGNRLDNTLTGNSAANRLTGGEGNDWLDGGAGLDILDGGVGSDTYVVDDVNDVIIDTNSQVDIDTVQSTVSWTLGIGSGLENLVLLGTGNISGTGNTVSNTITGNSGNNTLNGGAADDTLIGGVGDDTYVVDNAGDLVIENAAEGVDLVQSSVSYSLAANMENLTLTGSSSLSGTGNGLNNMLTGNSGANTLTGGGGDDTLNGGSGSDTMIGGLGDDTYVVAQPGDVVTEQAGAGTDLVQSSITYTLGDNVENLTLTGSSGIGGTGNALNNILIGNGGANALNGGDGDDTLDGGAGTDTMSGGLGNDVYFVNVSGDITTESAGQGIDTVNSAVTRTLSADIELLFLTGTTAINGTGNGLANLLRGNGANNTLQGSGGIDILEGGLGTDILSNTSGGKTLLNGGGGTDTLTGTANNDMLIGGANNDSITTGSGADIIVFNRGDGQDTVAASTTRDNTLSIGGGALYADLLFQKSGSDLIIQISGTDRITFTGYYTSTANRSVNNLQIVIEGTSDYDAGSADSMHNKAIQTFDFEGLVAAFDLARAATPGLMTWALTNALLAKHLSGSDTAALGGDLAYRYGRFGALSDISFTPAIGILSAGGFGTSAQTLQSLASLQDSTARLS